MTDYLSDEINPASAQCHGKAAFCSPQAARKVANRMAKRARYTGSGEPSFYRCAACGNYHIGRLIAARSNGAKRIKRPSKKPQTRRPWSLDYDTSEPSGA